MLALFTSFALHKVMIRASLLVVDDTRCFYGEVIAMSYMFVGPWTISVNLQCGGLVNVFGTDIAPHCIEFNLFNVAIESLSCPSSKHLSPTYCRLLSQ